MNNLRKAKPTDAEQISKLIKKNHLSQKGNKQKGFLRHHRGPKQVKKILKKSLVALIYSKNGKIVGFMNAYPQKTPKKKKINWKNEYAKKLYFDQKKSATVFLEVIDPNYLHQGIGSKLFEKMTDQLVQQGYKHLFATITLKPITNTASLNFVKSKGLRKVATGSIKSKPNTKVGIFWKKL
jgi:ribosomal protein S18 acetylase RimI-like enzyme